MKLLQLSAVVLVMGVILVKAFNCNWVSGLLLSSLVHPGIATNPVLGFFHMMNPATSFMSTQTQTIKIKRSVNSSSYGEIYCIKDCEYLDGMLNSPRPGLEMINLVYKYLPQVKANHKIVSPDMKQIISKWIALLTTEIPSATLNPWKLASKWASPHSLINDSDLGIANVITAMKKFKILRSDVGYKGTQFKMTFVLKGNQKVVFKPSRSKKTDVVLGGITSGEERSNGELASFYLSLLLNLTTVPLAASRKIHLRSEILRVATKELGRTFFIQGKSTCVYGVCYYCSKKKPICDDGAYVEGTIILWIPETLRVIEVHHPWKRTYREDKFAKWETDKDFCHKQTPSLLTNEKLPLLLSLTDLSVFDFLIQNGDRHEYHAVSSDPQSAIFMIDNGKSFGNPYVDHLDILSPLLQCCRIRRNTHERIKLLSGGGVMALKQMLQTNDQYPALTDQHFRALDRRIYFVLAAVEACRVKYGEQIFH